VLRDLGYRVDVRLLSHDAFQRLPANVLDSIQLKTAAWGDTAAGYVARWFTCGPNGQDWFCDPKIDRMNARARLIQATNPHAAAALWAQIDRRLVDRAAWVPMINESGIDFLSARVANYQSHPYWGVLVDQLWVRR
jgi:ABC-type transport system substrate-binding protein